MSEVTRFQMLTKGHPRHRDGLRVGFVIRAGNGWKAYPFTQDSPSRRAWPTPIAAAKRFSRHIELVPE